MVEMMATASVEASIETKRPTYCQLQPEPCKLNTNSMMGIMSPTEPMTTRNARVITCTATCKAARLHLRAWQAGRRINVCSVSKATAWT